ERGDRALRGNNEAVIHVARIGILSSVYPQIVDACGEGALAGTRTRTVDVDRSDGSVGSTHEAMIHPVCVKVPAIHRPEIVEAREIIGGCARRSLGINPGEMSIRRAQEAVLRVVCVNVYSHDLPEVVDARGNRALDEACACARSVERGERAVGSAQEAVTDVAR